MGFVALQFRSNQHVEVLKAKTQIQILLLDVREIVSNHIRACAM